MARASVLLVGLDPDIVDYTKSPVPELTAEKVRAAVDHPPFSLSLVWRAPSADIGHR